MDNGWIDNGASVGFGLQNSSGVNRFEFFFKGGDSSYSYNDGSAFTLTGVGFTADGLHVEVTVKPSNQVQLVVKNSAQTSTLFSNLITLASSNLDMSKLRLFNAFSGNGGNYDAFFNNVTTPEPSSAIVVMILAGSVGSMSRRGSGQPRQQSLRR